MASDRVWVGFRQVAAAIYAGDLLPVDADAQLVRDTVGAEVQAVASGARAGR